MGKSNWAAEDYTDFNIQPDPVKRSCHLCAHADKRIQGDKMTDCARCIESGWMVKTKFKHATRAKASKGIPDQDLLAQVDKLTEDPGALIEYLDQRKLPELARLTKLLGYTVPFGSKKNTYINEIVAGGM